MEEINILSMIIATLTPTLVGMIWYSDFLFGPAWMTSIGMTKDKQKSGNMILIISISLLMAFIMSYFLMQFNNDVSQEGQYDSFLHGAWHGTVLSIFIVIPIFISNGLFEQKPWKNIVINTSYWLITLAIMSGVIDAMNHWS